MIITKWQYTLVGIEMFISFTGCGDVTNKSSFKSLIINGIVISKYQENTGCFGAIVIKQNDVIDTIHNIFNCTGDKNSENQFGTLFYRKIACTKKLIV